MANLLKLSIAIIVVLAFCDLSDARRRVKKPKKNVTEAATTDAPTTPAADLSTPAADLSTPSADLSTQSADATTPSADADAATTGSDDSVSSPAPTRGHRGKGKAETTPEAPATTDGAPGVDVENVTVIAKDDDGDATPAPTKKGKHVRTTGKHGKGKKTTPAPDAETTPGGDADGATPAAPGGNGTDAGANGTAAPGDAGANATAASLDANATATAGPDAANGTSADGATTGADGDATPAATTAGKKGKGKKGHTTANPDAASSGAPAEDGATTPAAGTTHKGKGKKPKKGAATTPEPAAADVGDARYFRVF